ncbi:MAG: cytosine deaminase [Cyanobacteria bacterium]|nr:cytosine deaminase [Cyanobacteriota bacterium]MDW8202325.1 cytosine deaminase [Cyanobacteriota bacterium SKYGB_h_bin112]
MQISATDHYWLRNAHVPAPLLTSSLAELPHLHLHDNLCSLDLEIHHGIIHNIVPAQLATESDFPAVPCHDLRGGIVFPCFVDMHTHLDKGHIWPRAANPDGTFASAMAAVQQDSEAHWTAEDVYRRMDFGLRCSYAHGTQAIRTHIDSSGEQAAISFGVVEALQQIWADRLTIQAACLIPMEAFLTPMGEQLADRLAALDGGVLGGLVLMHPELDQQLDRALQLAAERQLDVDFHADETLDPTSNALRHIAKAAIRNQFPGRITCGHCCSLSTQAPQVVEETLQLLQQAAIAIVSLPMCNLYLQDRQAHRTPRYRGVTLIQELQQAGIPVAIASDNCRDPFYAYGDHDMLEVLTMAVRIAQLDAPYGDVAAMVSQTPAQMMGLDTIGQIYIGAPADLVIFRARSFSELFSRSQHDRIVLRRGRAIDTTLPDYADLDNL